MVRREIGELLALHDAEAGHAVADDLVRLRHRHRAFADLLQQPFGGRLARHEPCEAARIELVFGNQHAGSEIFRLVSWQDRYGCLAENRAVVEFRRHQMDRDAAVAVTGLYSPLVRVQSGVLGQ